MPFAAMNEQLRLGLHANVNSLAEMRILETEAWRLISTANCSSLLRPVIVLDSVMLAIGAMIKSNTMLIATSVQQANRPS